MATRDEIDRLGMNCGYLGVFKLGEHIVSCCFSPIFGPVHWDESPLEW